MGDIVTPGHIFPLKARDGGVLVRTGQTEGSVDLARLAGLPRAGVICEIMNEDGTMARLPDLERFGARHKLRIVTVADIVRWRMRTEVLVERAVQAPLQVPGLGQFNACVYRSIADGGLHLALFMGDVGDGQPVLTRVQVAQPVSDVFGALSTDSGAQLDAALRAIHEAGRGVLLYMHLGGGSNPDQLIARIREHLAPTQHTSGPPNPESQLRELGTGAQILVDLGVRRLRLMTNNPRKIVGLEGFGLQVDERVPLTVPMSDDNQPFLRARRMALGHLLPDVPPRA
jgi:3,4-dihydroxy 2-butanone 4-phosphate synthase/GTP cyclohydrolase II